MDKDDKKKQESKPRLARVSKQIIKVYIYSKINMYLFSRLF